MNDCKTWRSRSHFAMGFGSRHGRTDLFVLRLPNVTEDICAKGKILSAKKSNGFSNLLRNWTLRRSHWRLQTQRNLVALMRKLLTILFLITSCANANAATFSHLYVVGDSFSDTGHGVQIGQLLSTSYYNQSEASNGPIWPEQLMAALGKPYNQGDNQAVSGAATYTYQTTFGSQLVTRPGLIDQINSFQLLDANRSVFAIWTGHNDLSLSPPDSLNQAADSALATVKNGVALLRKKGATRILVLGLCDWAVTPAAHRTPDQQGVMNVAVLRFNTGLQQFARQMTRKLAGRATVRYVDTYDFLDGVRGQTANPDGIGTTDPQWICCRDWSAGNNYGYWDGVHYTTFIYDQLAQKLKAIINKMK